MEDGLPSEWGEPRLDAIAQVTAGGSAPQESRFFGGELPFVRVSHLDAEKDTVVGCDLITPEAVETHGLQLFPKGTIVLPKSGASVRLEKRAVLPFDSYLVSHLAAVLTKPERADPSFLFFALCGVRFAKEKSDGYPTLRLSEIRETTIPLPPLPEQRAIAHVLRTVQRAKEQTEQVIAAGRELKRSSMRHLFVSGPVGVEELEGVGLVETTIGHMPSHWSVRPLGEIAEMKSGGTPDRNRPEYFGSGIPWIKSGELRDGTITATEESITEAGLVASNASVFPTGTLVIALYGATAGRVALLGIDAATNQAVCAIHPRGEVTGAFLFHALMHRREQLLTERHGGAQPNLSQRALRLFPIPVPPLEEQEEISELLDALHAKIDAEKARRDALGMLFDSVLRDLMTARLRIDHPAPEFV